MILTFYYYYYYYYYYHFIFIILGWWVLFSRGCRLAPLSWRRREERGRLLRMDVGRDTVDITGPLAQGRLRQDIGRFVW